MENTKYLISLPTSVRSGKNREIKITDAFDFSRLFEDIQHFKYRDTEIPTALLQTVTNSCKNTTKFIDQFRYDTLNYMTQEAKDAFWQPSVYLPFNILMKLCYDYVQFTAIPSASNELKFDAAFNAATYLSCVLSWRPTQDIVTFNSTLYNELKDTPITGDLPVDILRRLPAWCIYVKTPNIIVNGTKYDGFFVSLEDEICPVLSITLVSNDLDFLRLVFRADKGNLEECIKSMNENGRKGRTDYFLNIEIDEGICTIMNMIIYICSYGISDSIKPYLNKPSYPVPKKTKKGWRMFPPNKPIYRILGNKFCDIINNARQEISVKHSSGYSIRPHVRRAHWHHYWTGVKSKNEEKKLIVKWLYPCIVGSNITEEEQLAS